MGFKPLARFLQIDLPLSLPVMFAGLRVVSVSNISLVSVAALLGIGNLGMLFTSGLQRDFVTEVVVGIIAILILALLMDAVLVLLERLLTPWTRAGAGEPEPARRQDGVPVRGASRLSEAKAGGGRMSNVFTDTFAWLADPAHWTGSSRDPGTAGRTPAVHRARHADCHRHRRSGRPVRGPHRTRDGSPSWPSPAPCAPCPPWAC